MVSFKPYVSFFLVYLALGVSGNAVQQCISSISKLTQFTPTSPGYNTSIRPFNLRPPMNSPQVVAFPETSQQIQTIIKCAKDTGSTVSFRSGGHSYGAYAYSGKVVIDMSKMNSVTLHSDNTAVAQTGTLVGDLALKIFDGNERALPHASCPGVGVGGHTTMGGYGYFSRIAGLLLDTVVSADVVLADGSYVTLSPNSYSDLFQAVRGGGAGFCAIVSWTYQTLAAPPEVVKWGVTFPNALSASQAVEAHMLWQSFIQNKPDEFVSAVVFDPANTGTVSVSYEGNYYGSTQEALALIKPFVESLPSQLQPNLTVQSTGWIENLQLYAGGTGKLSSTLNPDKNDIFYTKSLVVNSATSKEVTTAFIDYLISEGSKENAPSGYFVQGDLYGGKIAQGNTKETSFGHRGAFVVYQFYASSAPNPFPETGFQFMDNMVKTLNPSAAPGGYPNYMDTGLAKDQLWKEAYYPNNAEQLQSVKDKYDPFGVFDFAEGFSIHYST